MIIIYKFNDIDNTDNIENKDVSIIIFHKDANAVRSVLT